MLPRLGLELARKLSPQKNVDAIRSAPVRILQIGTGNFLRAFCGWMFERMNARGVFHGSIAVAPATRGSPTLEPLHQQDGCYTVLQRGLQSEVMVEKTDLITCVTRLINPYTQWSDFLTLAGRPELRCVVSNTTEAGIVYRPTGLSHECPATFPAQMTAVLFHRFSKRRTASGLVFLPCELTEHNGRLLREIVLQHASEWGLGDAFTQWVARECTFCSTLVDRIVTGYPSGEAEQIAEKLGYRDALLTACELYHSWIIEAPGNIAEELRFADAGLNVRWCRDVAPYRTRKVRLLNGAHTVMTPVAFLAGMDTVLDAMRDASVCAIVSDTLYQEILPTIEPPEFPADAESMQKLLAFDPLDAAEVIMEYENSFGESVTDEQAGTIHSPDEAIRLIRERAALEKQELKQFADDVLSRFRNPTIQHRLLSIALNSTSKWKVRVLPSLLQSVEMTGKLPRRLAFSLAALLVLYRVDLDEHANATGKRGAEPYELKDTPEALRLLSGAWKNYDNHGDPRRLSTEVLGQVSLWEMDLNAVPRLTDSVAADVMRILERGMSPVLEELQDE